jgi:hypothetical protein
MNEAPDGSQVKKEICLIPTFYVGRVYFFQCNELIFSNFFDSGGIFPPAMACDGQVGYFFLLKKKSNSNKKLEIINNFKFCLYS